MRNVGLRIMFARLAQTVLVALAVHQGLHCLGALPNPVVETPRDWIDALASRNPEPLIVAGRVGHFLNRVPLFSENYDWTEQDRILGLWDKLAAVESDNLWPLLAEHMDDSRYALSTIGDIERDSHVTRRVSVGDLCRLMADGYLNRPVWDAESVFGASETKVRRAVGELELGKAIESRPLKPLWQAQLDACQSAINLVRSVNGLREKPRAEFIKKMESHVQVLGSTHQAISVKADRPFNHTLFKPTLAQGIRRTVLRHQQSAATAEANRRRIAAVLAANPNAVAHSASSDRGTARRNELDQQIAALANHNPAPAIVNLPLPSYGTIDSPVFAENFNWDECGRVTRSIQSLAKVAPEELWPVLVDHLNDGRYSLTLAEYGLTQNISVGGWCQRIIGRYVDYPGAWTSSEPNGQAAATALENTDWPAYLEATIREQEGGIKLYQLQIKVHEHALDVANQLQDPDPVKAGYIRNVKQDIDLLNEKQVAVVLGLNFLLLASGQTHFDKQKAQKIRDTLIHQEQSAASKNN
jgi:hypothetical protein